jgi:uncharacterized membrane protein
MMRDAILVIELLAAVGAGLAGGVFFAFSTFVMRGLGNLPAADGIKAMNAINVAAVRPPLMILLFGTAAVCVGVIVALILTWGNHTTRLAESGVTLSLAGAILYVLGAVLVTRERNVPLNRALGAATDASGPMIWKMYLRDWVKWNHVRTVACTIACGLLLVGLWWQVECPWRRPCVEWAF